MRGFIVSFVRVVISFVIGFAMPAVVICQAVTSCSPRVYPSEVRDSVRVEIRERVVHDTAILEVPREIEKVVTKDTVSVLANTWARSEAKVDGGLLHHSLETVPQIVKVPVTMEVHDTTYVEKRSETEIVEVNRLTRWQTFWLMLGKILGAALGLALVAWVVRLVLKFYGR